LLPTSSGNPTCLHFTEDGANERLETSITNLKLVRYHAQANVIFEIE